MYSKGGHETMVLDIKKKMELVMRSKQSWIKGEVEVGYEGKIELGRRRR
jgi:hypothetical protein